MPIYAYRCSACGHAKDVLQKLSDPVLSTCPACGGQTFSKQVTAAGFQLKGSGWYVTDFRGGNNGAPAASAGKDADAPAGAGDAAKPAADAPAAAPAAKSDAKADAAKPAAPSTGGSTPTTA